MHFTVLRINFLLFALLGGSQLFAQAPISRLFGTYQTETGVAGLVLQDSTIYALGTSSAFVEYSSQLYLIRVDKNGDLLWSKFYGGTGVDDAVDMYVDLAVDTSIYIASTSFINFSKGYDVKLTKVDKNGNFIWEKSYGTTDWDIASKMIKTSTGMFAICGKTYGNSFGSTDGMLLLLDMNGDSIVFQNYGDAEENMFHDLIERSTDTLVFCGETYTVGGMQRAWLFELNIETGSSANAYYGSVANRTFSAIDLTPGGNYLLAQTTDTILPYGGGLEFQFNIINPVTHQILVEYPVDHNALYPAPADEISTDIMFFGDSTIIILGTTESFGLGEKDVFYYRIDTLGNYVTGTTFGTVNEDLGNVVIPNANGTFALIGTSAEMFGVNDLWIINLESNFNTFSIPDGQLDINAIHETNFSAVNVNVYPNPFNDIVTIQSVDAPENITVYNAIGHVVSSATNTSTIDLSALTAGTYFLSIDMSDGSIARKCLIKAK